MLEIAARKQGEPSNVYQAMQTGCGIVLRAAILASLALAFLAPGALAAASFETERVRVELMPEEAGLPAEGGTVWLALRQSIAPGWHTYWQNPGDSGEPTDIEWDLPPGFVAGDIRWQPPERQPYGPLVNFGYEHENIMLIPLEVPAGLRTGSQVPIRAHVFWLVCAEVCIPEDGPVELSLPIVAGGGVRNFAAVDVFARARERLPQPSPWAAQFEEVEGFLRVALMGLAFAGPLDEGRITSVTFFPEIAGLIDNAAPQEIRFGAEGMTLSTVSGARFRRDAVPEVIRGLIRLEEEIGDESVSRALAIEATEAPIPTAAMSRSFVPQGAYNGIGFARAALFAILGGLILNLMPCVFPIVFLKALTFVSVAHERPWRVRSHGMAYTVGILVSFSLIALLLMALRASGAQIGWGFQLQSPIVVASFAALLFAIGLNLSGVYTIGTSIMGLGGSLAERRGISGSFFTGVLAVIVAAPCTAPFMGLALGFALTQSAIVGLAIFVALGFGMALPYLVLSFAPTLLRYLPRPGAWMERLKQFLALPIYAWVLYLLWVLAQQASFSIVLTTLAVLLTLALGAWVFDMARTKVPANLSQLAMLILLVGVMGGAVSVLPRAGASGDAVLSNDDAIPSVAYSLEALELQRTNNSTVFVNFTAAWCITCLVNERVVFADPRVEARLTSENVVYMKGDWTNRDAEIAQALERFGRPGVPLYVVYRPGETPQVLPQVLTPDILLGALGED